MKLDNMISGDLAALGENSRRDVPALDAALRITDAYRDDRPGAEARRNALADERKRELVLMPLTLAHVFAHRVGRIAAGAMALVVSAALLVMLVDPLMTRFASLVVPGLNVGMLVTISALCILGAYVIATWIAEVWFAHRMRTAIKTGNDAYEDLDHLARGPLEIAHVAVQKIDGWATGLFLAGATAITITFGYITIIVGLNHTISDAWSVAGVLETGALQRNIACVGLALVATTLASAWVGRTCAGDRVSPLGSWSALAIAALVAIVTIYNGFHVAIERHHSLVELRTRYALTTGATFSVFVPIAWLLLAWRRRERTRIG